MDPRRCMACWVTLGFPHFFILKHPHSLFIPCLRSICIRINLLTGCHIFHNISESAIQIHGFHFCFCTLTSLIDFCITFFYASYQRERTIRHVQSLKIGILYRACLQEVKITNHIETCLIRKCTVCLFIIGTSREYCPNQSQSHQQAYCAPRTPSIKCCFHFVLIFY